MRIGELSARAGVNVQTIRFYERQKLLRPPPRSPSGYRSYAEADLDRVKFIKRCQCLGFTLKEVRILIDTHDPRQSSWTPQTRRRKNLQIARDRVRLIDEKMQTLERIRESLMAVLETAETRQGETLTACVALREAQKFEKEGASPSTTRRKKTS